MSSQSKQQCQFLSSLQHFDSSQFIIDLTSNSITSKHKTNLFDQKNNEYENPLLQLEQMVNFGKQISSIKQYIQCEQQCRPLLIHSQTNDNTDLLRKLIHEYQREQSQTKLFLLNFSSVTPVYSEILYSTMVKLKILFNIEQKVETNEQKIRRFFNYFLDVSSKQIDKNNLGYESKDKQSVIIIIDGVQELTNLKNQRVFPQFWLPQTIPKHIKLILTGKSEEKSVLKLISQKNVSSIQIPDVCLNQRSISQLKPEFQRYLKNIKHSPTLFELKSVLWFMNSQQNFKVQPSKDFSEILSSYIDCCSNKLRIKENQIKSVLLCLTLSRKGLTLQDFQNMIKLKPEKILELIYYFQPLISNFKQYYLITKKQVVSAIQKIYDPNKQKSQAYSIIIYKTISKNQLSIKRLQEEIHLLSLSSKYFEVKQLITQIENFLLLLTPPCKFLLHNTWKIIQTKLNSDPVYEYNKMIESFLTHYHPKQEELFQIIFSISIFLKEYSEFEDSKVPMFRHPLIRGDEEQFRTIGINGELKGHKMITPLKQIMKEKVQFNAKIVRKAQKDNKKQQYSSKHEKQEINSQILIEDTSRKSIQISSQVSYESSGFLGEIQSINLQIDQNKAKFKSLYLERLQPYMKEFYLPYRKMIQKDTFVVSKNQTQVDEEDGYSEGAERLMKQLEIVIKNPQNSLKKTKDSLILKSINEYNEQHYHREENNKFYYYKEWIWIQFPWICQSLNHDFSTMIKLNISTPTQYMSVSKQISMIKQLLSMLRHSKQNQQTIFQNKKQIQLTSIDPSRLKKSSRINNNLSVIRNSLKQSTVQSRLTVDMRRKEFGSAQKQNKSTIIMNSNLNVARYQLDLNHIDQKLKKQLGKQRTSICLCDSRAMKSRAKLNTIVNQAQSIPSPFLTQSENKSVNYKSSLFLPQISKVNKSGITQVVNIKKGCIIDKKSINRYNSQSRLNSTEKQNSISVLQKGNKLILQFDKLTSENHILKNQIEQIEQSLLMLESIDSVSILQKTMQKIPELEEIKHQIQQKHKRQQKLKSRLQTIIKICDHNKSHEVQSEGLQNFVQNLKKMTKQQQKNKKTKLDSFIFFITKSINEITELSKTKQNLCNDLTKYKVESSNLVGQMEQYQEDFEYQNKPKRNEKSENSHLGIRKKNFVHPKKPSILKQKLTHFSKSQSNKSKLVTRSKNVSNTSKIAKNTSFPVQLSEVDKKLHEIFQVNVTQIEQSVQNSQYFLQEFQQKMTKYKELSMECDQIDYSNQSLKNKILLLTHQISKIPNFKTDDESSHSKRSSNEPNNQVVTMKTEQLQEVRKRNTILQQCVSTYIK